MEFKIVYSCVVWLDGLSTYESGLVIKSQGHIEMLKFYKKGAVTDISIQIQCNLEKGNINRVPADDIYSMFL